LRAAFNSREQALFDAVVMSRSPRIEACRWMHAALMSRAEASLALPLAAFCDALPRGCDDEVAFR